MTPYITDGHRRNRVVLRKGSKVPSSFQEEANKDSRLMQELPFVYQDNWRSKTICAHLVGNRSQLLLHPAALCDGEKL